MIEEAEREEKDSRTYGDHGEAETEKEIMQAELLSKVNSNEWEGFW